MAIDPYESYLLTGEQIEDLASRIASKQDELTAGTGINIDAQNVISATGTASVTDYFISNTLEDIGLSTSFTIYSDESLTTAVSKSDFFNAVMSSTVRLTRNNPGNDSVEYYIDYSGENAGDWDENNESTYNARMNNSVEQTVYGIWWDSTLPEVYWKTTSQPKLTAGSNITISGDTISATDTTYSAMTGATSGAAGASGLVPAPAAGDNTKVLTGDGNWTTFTPELVEMSYGEANAWAKFIAAYNAKCIVYCRASSNADPASGSQTRKAFMAYVNDAANPTSVEFQYYRSVKTKTDSQQGDQTLIYELKNTNGGTWSVSTRSNFTKINVDSTLNKTYTQGTSASVSLGAKAMTGATGSAAGTAGYVPAPASTDNTKFLKGDGTWGTPTDTTYSDFTGATWQTAGTHGLVPAPAAGDDYNKVLSGDGTWKPAVTILYMDATATGVTRSLYSDYAMTDAVTMEDIILACNSSKVVVHVSESSDPDTYQELTLQDSHNEQGNWYATFADADYIHEFKATNNPQATVFAYTVSAAGTTYSDFTGATSSVAGAHGLVPAPTAGDEDKVLTGDGNWTALSPSQAFHSISVLAYDGFDGVILTEMPKVSFIPVLEEDGITLGIDDIVTYFEGGDEVQITVGSHSARVIGASLDESGNVYTFTIAVTSMGDPRAATTVTQIPSAGSCGVPYVIDFVYNSLTSTKIAIPHVPGKYTILAPIVPVDTPTVSWSVDFQNIKSVPWVVGIPSYDPIPSWAEPVASPSGSRAESAAAFMMMAHINGMDIELAAIGATNQSNVQVNTIPYVTAKSFSSSITNSSGAVMPIFSTANNMTPQIQYMPIENFNNVSSHTGVWPVMGTAISGSAYFELNFNFIYRQNRSSNPAYGTLYAESIYNGSTTNVWWDGTIK